jgi:S-adenosylmethionine hydrolase
MGPIVLLTDYGLQDTYVGVLKGVIARIAPQAVVIDLLHHVRPQQIRQGAYALWVAEPYFPDGSIFVAVVDPGVGTERRAVAVEINRKYFVAPDNGLLSFLLQRYGAERAVSLDNPAYRLPHLSATFHGRDIFAPAAAYLAQGVRLEQLGMPLDPGSLQQLPPPRCDYRDGVWLGEVLHIDRFGNLITSLSARALQLGDSPQERSRWRLAVRSRTIAGLSRTFADVREGEFCAYVGSDGLLEIACRNGSAAIQLQAALGDGVRAWRV